MMSIVRKLIIAAAMISALMSGVGIPVASASPSASHTTRSAAEPGYLTIMFGRSNWQAASGRGCIVTGGPNGRALTLGESVRIIKQAGLTPVGGVTISRTPDAGNPYCFAGYTLQPTWQQLRSLTAELGMTYVSQGMNYADMTAMTTDTQRYRESCATIPILRDKGYPDAAALFNYANNKQDSAAQRVVNSCFAFGRRYGSGINTVSNLTKPPYSAFTRSINGGKCRNVSLTCATMSIKNNRVTSTREEMVRTLSPEAGKWGILQLYRLVEGKYGTPADYFSWDCTGPWPDRWTKQPETFCANSLEEALRARSMNVISVTPADMARKFGRPPFN